MKDHTPIPFREFRGLYHHGMEDIEDTCPQDRFPDCLNVRFRAGSVGTREGSSLSLATTMTDPTIKRFAVYRVSGQADRLLLLNGTGKLYDSSDMSTAILDIAGMTDFAVQNLYGRAYISPSDGKHGLPGEKLYVYDGSGAARPAAGAAPTGFTLGAAVSATSGKIEAGKHLFAVAYETRSGYITKPGPAIKTEVTFDGTKAVDFSNIPVGPSYVVARILLASKLIPDDWTGNQDDVELFFIPDGRIPNNVDVTLSNVDFYDSQLQDSADRLSDQLSEIPAGVGLTVYGGRLVSYGEDANENIFRASLPGEPESFDEVEGFGVAGAGDASGGILNALEFRGSLHLLKFGKSYSTRDTGDNAAFWDVPLLDGSVGCGGPHALARVFDQQGNSQDVYITTDRSGIHLFNGSFSGVPLTHNIDDIWATVNQSALTSAQLILDPINLNLYAALPFGADTTPTRLLVANYEDGTEVDQIKWSKFEFYDKPISIWADINFTTKKAQLEFAAATGNIYKLDPTATNDYGHAFTNYLKFPYSAIDDSGIVLHFGGIRLRIKGSGALNITLKGLDDTQTLSPPSLVLMQSPGVEVVREFIFVGERCSVKLSMSNIDEWFNLSSMKLFAVPLWETRPQ